ncbi:hypothetical protein ACQ4PT_030086 [Festuca glaucescens]
MLLYQAPTGLAVFSFDGGCLNDPVEEFWANLAPPSLEYFLKYERVSTPINLANEAIDDHLAKKLTRLCGSEKKLAVGSAKHKRIIEMKLVNESIAELAHQLLDTKLREMELLKFFSILLKDFIVISSIDTKRWMLFHFATVPKMICCPGSSYEIYRPDKIFSRVEYRKIEANVSRYKPSFSKIGVLNVYEEFFSLYSKKCLLLFKLGSLLKKAKEEESAMLLYEAPSGIAIFSFDGAYYLNNSVKEFWAHIPQLSLEFFLKYERVSTPIDLATEAIDNLLAKRLSKLCGSEKKLAVGSSKHKRIIEMKLGITCVYVDVPDCEVIICSLKNPRRTLLPQEKSEMYKRDCLPSGKELITFLCQHDFDIKPEMVDKTIVELAHLLHGIELREMEHLKFFRILLKDFIVISGMGTKNWSLIELATVLKMICHRGSSYEVYHPVEIFSRDEHQKIAVNTYRYKTRFSNIDVLSVYEDVISLDSDKYILLIKLDYLLEKAKQVPEKAEVIFPTGSKFGKEVCTTVDDRLNSITEDKIVVKSL